jgi:hypothetical protein
LGRKMPYAGMSQARWLTDLLSREMLRLMHRHVRRLDGWLLDPSLLIYEADIKKLDKYAKALKGLREWLEDFDARLERYYGTDQGD